MTGMSDLFVHEPKMNFERPKKAGIEVDENPQMWARQVLSELYRQCPEITDYTPNVMFMKTDEEQGYALGCVVLVNSTDSALAVSRVGSSPNKVLVPVIIKGHELQPLDLLMTKSGKMFPLTGNRLREALFRPETFEMVTEDYGDTSLWNMFYPPGRSDNTFGSGMSQGVDGGTAGAVTFIQGPGMKMSADFEMLRNVVGPSAIQPDLDWLRTRLESEPGLLEAALDNPSSKSAMVLLSSIEKGASSSSASLVKAAADSAHQHVTQLGHGPHGYWVKMASRDSFYHSPIEYMDRRAFLKFAGPEVTQKVDTDGTVTMSEETVVTEEADASASKWKAIEENGIYKVKTISGKEMTGWVLPEVIDLDGTRVPLAIFTNGAASAIQGQIAGARVATGVDLPSAPAKGTGAFYVSGQGGIQVTVPLVVEGSESQMNGGDCYIVHTLTGEQAHVYVTPGIVAMKAAKGDFFVPATAKFLPLDNDTMTQLVETPDGLGKTASAVLQRQIHIQDVGGEYQLDYVNLPKIAGMFPRVLDHDTAMMALCLSGLSAPAAINKLASAANGLVKVAGVNDIATAHDRLQVARKTASAKVASIRSLRQDLIKEAAVLPDVMTVDSVLSLGFINSENVRMFVTRLPYLEKALSMVCELLLGARMGLTEVPEPATARAARGLDQTIQGLRALSLRPNEDA